MASLANTAPASTKAPKGSSNYKQRCALTFNTVGSSPEMTKNRAARNGVTEADIKNLYVSTEGTTLLRAVMANKPNLTLIEAVNAVRKAHDPKAVDMAMIPAFEKIVNNALNGTTRGGQSQVKDKVAQADAKAAAIHALGLDGVLKVGETGANGRVTIQAADTEAEAPAETAAAPAPQAEAPKSDGKDKSKSK